MESWTFSTDSTLSPNGTVALSMSRQVIRLHPAAPAKPPETAPCNGCGVCCAAEPCPIGVLVSGRRTGACARCCGMRTAGCTAAAWSRAAEVLRWLPAVPPRW